MNCYAFVLAYIRICCTYTYSRFSFAINYLIQTLLIYYSFRILPTAIIFTFFIVTRIFRPLTFRPFFAYIFSLPFITGSKQTYRLTGIFPITICEENSSCIACFLSLISTNFLSTYILWSVPFACINSCTHIFGFIRWTQVKETIWSASFTWGIPIAFLVFYDWGNTSIFIFHVITCL